jgi:RimJ/RimL family protein N-acetyltransferase
VGYALFKNEVKRNGYMTEAMEALMNYMRVSKHYSFAFAYARVENEASNKILRKFFGEPYFTTDTYGHKTNLYGAFFK